MPIPTYTPGYPPDGSSLGQTKAVIRDNLDGTFQTLNVDHVNNNGQPGSQPAGYHTIIHEVTQTNVSTVTGVNQIFSGIPGTLIVNGVTTKNIPPNGDTQLYSLTGMGGLSQLTGNNASANGYNWVGGILLQWGSTTAVANSSSTTVTFPVTFPTAVFSVQATVVTNDNSSIRFSILNNASPSGFVTSQTSSAHFTRLYWFAIGN